MVKIYDSREFLWQWDIDQKLIVNDDCCEVHFDNGTTETAPVCLVREEDGVRVVDVPNILLQTSDNIKVYTYSRVDGAKTRRDYLILVRARTKPDDYVYTETEVKRWDDLVGRIEDLEKNGVSSEQIAIAVNDYLSKNPVSGVPPGGKTGQYLRKQSDADGDAVWSDLEIPEQYGLVTYDQDKTITIT